MSSSLPHSREGFFQALMVYPSIHHLVASTRRPRGGTSDTGNVAFDIGVPNLTQVLTRGLSRQSIVTIKGPRGTYKSHIARNFLLAGIAGGESVLLIHLGEREQFRPDHWAVARKSSEHTATSGAQQSARDDHGVAAQKGREDPVRAPWFVSEEVLRRFRATEEGRTTTEAVQWARFIEDTQRRSWMEPKNTSKFVRRIWVDTVGSCQGKGKEPRESHPILVEIDFKPGALLPEQFLKLVRDLFRQPRPGIPKIRRVVLDDVSLIGTSYPFLRDSRTTGDLFLTAFIHVARYHETDVLMVGTSGEFNEADDVVKRAATLADSVLACDYCDVFGDRFITVTGEGLMAGREQDVRNTEATDYGEYFPGVIVPKLNRVFDVELTWLEGLAGFETGEVHRPGVVLSVFSEGDTLRSYYDSVRTLLECAFACSADDVQRQSLVSVPPRRPTAPESQRPPAMDTKVSVREFGSEKSAALYDSLRVFSGKPIDKTVVCALDEFYSRVLPVTEGTDPDPHPWLCVLNQPQHEAQQPSQADGTVPASTADSAPSESSPEQTRWSEDDVAERDFDWRHFNPVLWRGEKYVADDAKVAAPYYSNVLLLAYRKSIEGLIPLEPTPEASSNGRIVVPCLKSWKDLLVRVNDRRTREPGSRELTFECGAWSTETLACIVLDTVCGILSKQLNGAGLGARYEPSMREIAGRIAEDTSASLEELDALSQLFGKPIRGKEEDNGSSVASTRKLTGIDEDTRKLTSTNADIYVCWYSQLRELVKEDPEGAPDLRVAALPGGGIRGDWYLGIVRGSVSVTLGRKIIEILCGRMQDNARFINGVGLPAHQGYHAAKRSSGYKAWPRANVMLSEVLEIHRDARSRSRIDGYAEARATLGALGEQVAQPLKDRTCQREVLQDFLSRLKELVEVVLPAKGDSGAPESRVR